MLNMNQKYHASAVMFADVQDATVSMLAMSTAMSAKIFRQRMTDATNDYSIFVDDFLDFELYAFPGSILPGGPGIPLRLPHPSQLVFRSNLKVYLDELADGRGITQTRMRDTLYVSKLGAFLMGYLLYQSLCLMEDK